MSPRPENQYGEPLFASDLTRAEWDALPDFMHSDKPASAGISIYDGGHYDEGARVDG